MTSYVRVFLAFVFTVACFVSVAQAQTETATISGRVTDESGATVPGAEVQLQSIDRGTLQQVTSNGSGIYSFSAVEPGQYHATVRKAGFKTIDFVGLVVNVQDHIEKNFQLQLGSVSESVTVNADDFRINTTDATVSTVVDRNFAENMPLNGRSFQTLIELAPGIVPIAAGTGNGVDSGQFSVNGQRAASNYWMVDGVSANVGSNVTFNGQQMSGAIGTSSVFGGTNSLVAVDAMQEFRIQTSTFAPEFGRTPGAQISIVTRSGTNKFHGSAFDYLRNDIFDANNWFNTAQPPALPKAEERQNDFGGTFSGPILKDRTFFFFSYEGLRLRLPTTTLTQVPDASARQNALPALRPFLNAFPLDPNQPDLGNGIAQFNASYSNPGTLDDYSLRVDHRLTDRFALFGRYNYAPSNTSTRGGIGQPLSSVLNARSTAQQFTIGITGNLSPRLVNEIRFNYSKTDAAGFSSLDSFGNAIPVSPPFPSPITSSNGIFAFFPFILTDGELEVGPGVRNVQRQFNVVETFGAQEGSHALKFGVDYRRLTPIFAPYAYGQVALFSSIVEAETGQLCDGCGSIFARRGATFLFRNLSLFAQDTWRAAPRLTVTYGLRWDVDFSPTTIAGPPPIAFTNFSLNNVSGVSLAPSGTPPFETSFRNFAPRLGGAYRLSQRPDWGLVARAGFGLFYDLVTSEAGNTFVNAYNLAGPSSSPGPTFPFSPAQAAAPPFLPPSATNPENTYGFDPNLKAPYTLQWNVALEQELGAQQSLSVSYVGAVGRRLLQTAQVVSPNPSFSLLGVVTNSATSYYNALQLQFHRNVAANLQVLSSYTWSHSIDDASAGSAGTNSNAAAAEGNPGNRGPSDFDIRQAFSMGATYAIPSVGPYRILREIAGGWSLQSIIQAHTAAPVEVFDSIFSQLTNSFETDVRPDLVSGVPLYLYGPQFPGGKAFNPSAFTLPPTSPSGCDPDVAFPCNPARQGDLGRNALRGFGLFQWDLGIHRDFPIREFVKLQLRAEMFNALNHPNFAPPVGDMLQPTFGKSTELLNQYLGGSSPGQGGLSPLYQIGGPRSIQFALKLSF